MYQKAWHCHTDILPSIWNFAHKDWYFCYCCVLFIWKITINVAIFLHQLSKLACIPPLTCISFLLLVTDIMYTTNPPPVYMTYIILWYIVCGLYSNEFYNSMCQSATIASGWFHSLTNDCRRPGSQGVLCVNVSSSSLCINQSAPVNELLQADEGTHESMATWKYGAMEM